MYNHSSAGEEDSCSDREEFNSKSGGEGGSLRYSDFIANLGASSGIDRVLLLPGMHSFSLSLDFFVALVVHTVNLM